jgi:hypothetical protein
MTPVWVPIPGQLKHDGKIAAGKAQVLLVQGLLPG